MDFMDFMDVVRVVRLCLTTFGSPSRAPLRSGYGLLIHLLHHLQPVQEPDIHFLPVIGGYLQAIHF
jgi:hypothetical protein